MKGTVSFQFVDLLFNPISNLEHKVEDIKGKTIAAGLSNNSGKSVVISRDLGTCLKVFVKKLNGEYKYVGIYFLYKDGDVKVFRSPKILIKKLQRYEKKTEDGNVKPLTYIIKDKDTLFDIAKKYHTTVALLCGLNKIKDANRIYKGQKIQVHPNYKASGGNASHNIINTNSLNNSEIYANLNFK